MQIFIIKLRELHSVGLSVLCDAHFCVCTSAQIFKRRINNVHTIWSLTKRSQFPHFNNTACTVLNKPI